MRTNVDFGGDAVIIAGGTRGLGKALGMEFARAGARVFLTHRWGSADESALRSEFEAAAVSAPFIIQSDASDPVAARALMHEVRQQADRVTAIISNVAFAKIVRDISELQRSSLELSLRYSAWPILDLLRSANEVFGRYPRHALAVSTADVDHCLPGYDMAAIAKSALEMLCRYLALRLRGEDVRVNVVRCGPLDTDSSRATFGAAVDHPVLREHDIILDPHDVARACVAMCSGLMDSVTGQVITVDEGISLVGPLAWLAPEALPAPFPRRTDDES